jgi:predicted RNA binding protein YcfA (HicA-like mRNA interferase family)
MKDTTAIIRELRRKGYSVEQGKNGHWNVRNRQGKYLTNFSFSPKREPNRQWLVKLLKRAGIEIS